MRLSAETEFHSHRSESLHIAALERQAEPVTRQVGSQRAIMRIIDTIEKKPLDTHMIVEVFDVTEARHGARSVKVQRRRGVGREGNPVGIAERPYTQELSYSAAARRICLKYVHRLGV